jgi:hypothetical protein
MTNGKRHKAKATPKKPKKAKRTTPAKRLLTKPVAQGKS